RLNSNMTFKGVGIDSLMAIQLRNLLEKDLFIKLPVGKFWVYPAIQEYALFLRDTLSAQINTQSDQVRGLSSAALNNLLERENAVQNGNSNWFVVPKPNSKASVRLFCFHDAGGSSDLFHNWENI